MKDHPLGLAARYNDADVEEHGLVPTIEKNGLQMDALMYLIEQRAMRCVLSVTRPDMLKRIANGMPFHLTFAEQTMAERYKAAYMDGILIGWRGHKIAKLMELADGGPEDVIKYIRAALYVFTTEEANYILAKVRAAI